MKKRLMGIVLALLAFVGFFSSCTSAFPNDKLAFLWRLDKIELLDGSGNPFDEMQIEAWYSFARDLVEIRKGYAEPGVFGILTDYGDSLRFDFSLHYDSLSLAALGMFEKVTMLKVEKMDSEMILSNNNSCYYFTRW